MDIDFLLSLQSFREAGGQWLAPVMSFLSKASQYGLILIPILIFWNAGREEGYWYMVNLGLADFVNNLVKLTACVYRPWVRDGRVVPWGNAVEDATGYSFPSGHTATAASVLGPVGLRQWRRRKWLSLISFALILLVAFSRTYLGVHTPQDVLAGMLETGLIVAFNTWLFRRLRGNERKQDLWTLIGFAAVAASLIYYRIKPYPMDEAEGALLVNPQGMMKDAYMSAGTMLGFLTGSLWERKRIHYDSSGTFKQRLLRSAVGVILVLLIYLVLRKALVRLIGVQAGSLISMFLLTLFVTGIFPWCIMRLRKRPS